MGESEAVERNRKVNAEATRRLKASAAAPVNCVTGTAADSTLSHVTTAAEKGKQVGEKIAEGHVPGLDAENTETPETSMPGATWNQGAFAQTDLPMITHQEVSPGLSPVRPDASHGAAGNWSFDDIVRNTKC